MKMKQPQLFTLSAVVIILIAMAARLDAQKTTIVDLGIAKGRASFGIFTTPPNLSSMLKTQKEIREQWIPKILREKAVDYLLDKAAQATEEMSEEILVGELWLPKSVRAVGLPSHGPRAVLFRVPLVINPEEGRGDYFSGLKVTFGADGQRLNFKEVYPKKSWAKENWKANANARAGASIGIAQIQGGIGFDYQPISAEIVSGAFGRSGYVEFLKSGGRYTIGQFDVIILAEASPGVSMFAIDLELAVHVTDYDVVSGKSSRLFKHSVNVSKH